MKKFVTNFGISILPFSFSILVSLFAAAVSGISTTLVGLEGNVVGTPMHSVEMTQKGYIQFLRWELPVPEIHEFTFCLWVKSTDLKHHHSILSYSRNEEERLIRSWISSRGRTIHLEISGVEIFRRPVRIQEHRWYHICQSWENRVGRYALWIDGHLKLQGRLEEMIDHVIPAGGDIVLGQEYTDFNKGLEEGIEGSVLGFNLLLVSAFESFDRGQRRFSFRSADEADRDESAALPAKTQTKIAIGRDADFGATRALDSLVSIRFALTPNWSQRISRSNITKAAKPTEIPASRELHNNGTREEETPPSRRHAIVLDVDDTIGEIDLSKKLPNAALGLQLVKLSYVHCQLGRGSPPIGGPLMLISWSRTPVRVFGGATVKNVGNECGKF